MYLPSFQGDEFESRKTSGASSEYGEEDLEVIRQQALEQLATARVSTITFFAKKLIFVHLVVNLSNKL